MKKILLFLLILINYTAKAQNFAISTNVADYANFGTLNIDAAYALDRHWSINTTLKYNPFKYGSGEEAVVNKQRSISGGARYWPWHIYSGWWLSGLIKYQEYSQGGHKESKTTEGDRYGAGIGGGYTMMLSPSLNLEIGAALWSGYEQYKTYSCPTCGRELATGRKFFFLPTDIILALSYIF